MTKIYLVLSLLFLTSCKTLMLRYIIKDPKVENTSRIKSFQETNNFSTENSLILKADTSNAVERLLLGMSTGYYIFDKDGNQVCYNGASTCQGVQFRQLLDNEIDSFKTCKNDSVSLDKILGQSYDLNENPVNKSQFSNADYYVVSYWQKFMGGKRGYKEAITWMEDEIGKSKSPLKFTFIKINADMQENWGMAAGKKMKVKIKKKGSSMNLSFDGLPLKK